MFLTQLSVYGSRMRIILASQSPYRRAQLTQLGLKFTAARPEIDEDALKAKGPKDPSELTRYLALAKAESLAAPDALVLGSDQLVDLDGERLDKPGTPEKACEQLARMAGREHRLITSLALVQGERREIFTDITRIRLKPLDPETISAYVKLDQPLDCAGSYKIEKAGLGLVESIVSEDFSAIQGLPILSLCRGLENFGVKIWREQ